MGFEFVTQNMKAFAYLVFPNALTTLPEGGLRVGGEPMEHGIITSVTQGAMSGVYRSSSPLSNLSI